MKILYVHHAQRDISKGVSQENDITETGIKDAEILSELLISLKNIKAIYTSPYKRCMHTAQIINKNINVPIVEDERLNEWSEGCTRVEFFNRTIAAIDDIVKKYDDEDVVICVTSGVNITAFMLRSLNIKPTEETELAQAGMCSPVLFQIK